MLQVSLCKCKNTGHLNLSSIGISSNTEDYDKDGEDYDWEPELMQGLAQ